MPMASILREAVTAPVALALLIGAISAVAILFFGGKKRSDDDTGDRKKGDKKKGGPTKVAVMPADGVFTLETLGEFDGETGPICVAMCGKVVNVSSSENIRPGEGYGKLWAGKDATYSLATSSLKPEHANTLDFKLDDFSKDQQTALAGWYKHFTTKYPVVGTLKEYEGWDFSSVEAEAVHQRPFASSSAAADAPAAAEDEAEEAAAGASDAPAEGSDKAEAAGAGAGGTAPAEAGGKDGGLVLRAGEPVAITGLEGRPELNGKVGILKTYVEEKGRFAVAVDGESILLKPANLAAPPKPE